MNTSFEDIQIYYLENVDKENINDKNRMKKILNHEIT